MFNSNEFKFVGEVSKCNHGDVLRPYRGMKIGADEVGTVETSSLSATSSRTYNISGKAVNTVDSRHEGENKSSHSSSSGHEWGGSAKIFGIRANASHRGESSRMHGKSNGWMQSFGATREASIGGDFSTTESMSVATHVKVSPTRPTETLKGNLNEQLEAYKRVGTVHTDTMKRDIRQCAEQGKKMLGAASQTVGNSRITANSSREGGHQLHGVMGYNGSYNKPRLGN